MQRSFAPPDSRGRLSPHSPITLDSIALAGDAWIFKFIINTRQVREFQGEAKFLRGQRARAQTRTELLEQAVEQESQWLEQDNGMFQLDRFFKYQRRFQGDECARSSATREFLQLQALLSEAFAECDFRQCGECAQVADAPSGKGFKQAIGCLFGITLQMFVK